ncbi:hypothetical protein [Actinacidiphila sp. ITFR-21]|uniref:hypothetical protein n=1 Tax=Actinacidiphila sp. ITFR-21 TaxID=3075199 RepID=UPI00288BA3B1|nr:hypothetical protein [Streptomyces sp. ITFR-21]WNI15959.1 hypothetical protein RLT57_10800 [Streptomyces sp. ITFR-21]
MKRVAALLRTEAKDLKAITEGRGLKGRYADALRDGAGELEVRLRETAERYERVHGELTHWAGELAGFQAEADRILLAARADAERAAASGLVSGLDSGPGSVHVSGPGSGSGPVSGADPGPASGGDPAEDPTAAHRTSLAKVTAQRDHRAAHYAARIRDRIDDTIRDSRWERAKNAIDGRRGVVSFAVDVMSWVATGIAVTAITMTPAGWVAGLAIWLTFGVLAGHLLLASAGDGSWADVTMDLFGLLTMRAGTLALTRLRAVRDATKSAAELAAESRAAEEAARASRSLRDRTSAVLNRRASTRARRAKARHDRNIARAASRRAGEAAASAEAALPMPSASRWEAAAVGGERETANLFQDVKRLRAAYEDAPAVQRASSGAETHRRLFQGTWIAASTVDGMDKLLGTSDAVPSKPAYGPYSDRKARYTKEVGSPW